MLVIYWVLSQLLSYSILTWIGFAAVAFVAAWLLRMPGVFVGQVIVALAVAALDVQWIQAEIHKPGWNGQPDQDFLFMIGVVLRVILVNTALLPISFLTLRMKRRAGRGTKVDGD